jgi:hypothetical protein
MIFGRYIDAASAQAAMSGSGAAAPVPVKASPAEHA